MGDREGREDKGRKENKKYKGEKGGKVGRRVGRRLGRLGGSLMVVSLMESVGKKLMRNRQRVNNPKEISSRMWMLMFLRTKRSKKNKRFKMKNKKRKKTAKSKFLKKNKKLLQLNKNCLCITESNVQNVKFHQLLEIDTNAQYVNNLIFVVSAKKKMKNMNIN